MGAAKSESFRQQQLRQLSGQDCSAKHLPCQAERLGLRSDSHQSQGAQLTRDRYKLSAVGSRNSDLSRLLQNTEALQKQLVSALCEQTRQSPMATENPTIRQCKPGVTQNEHRLLKLLKKALKEKDRLNGQVAQLLDSQRRLLQQLHQTQQLSPLANRPKWHTLQEDSYVPHVRSSVPDTSTSAEFEAQLDQQLQQLQHQIDQLRKEPEEAITASNKPQSPSAAGAAAAVPSSMVEPGHSSAAAGAGWLGHIAVGQQQDVIAEQAATICELKRVIKELEMQTSVLRAQVNRDRDAAALVECQARLQDKELQIQHLQEQQTKLQELSQAAADAAQQSSKAAEEERDNLRQQLQQQQAAIAAQQEAVAQLQRELEQQTGSLSTTVADLKADRQHLLQRLQEANGRISDLHDELGPALLRGSPSTSRRSATTAAGKPSVTLVQDIPQARSCSAVLQSVQQQGGSGSAPAGGGLDSRLLFSSKQEQPVTDVTDKGTAQGYAEGTEISCSAKGADNRLNSAGSAAAWQVLHDHEMLQDQYKKLQAEHQKLLVKHAELKRQTAASTQQNDLMLLNQHELQVTNELYSQATQQVKKLQDELLKSRQAAATAAAAANTASQQQDSTVQKQQLLSLSADNARLAVSLAECMAEVTGIKKQQQQQQHVQTISNGRSPQDVSPFAAAAAPGIDAEAADLALQQQRLQLLVSQLAMVRDQVASSATLSNQQQQLLQQQQSEMLSLRQQLLSMQEKYGQLQKSFLQHQGAADTAAAAAAAAGSPAVAQVMQDSYQQQLQLIDMTVRLSTAEAEVAAMRSQQQSAVADKGMLEQLQAKNKALLQEVSRLLTDNNQLQQQLVTASPSAAPPPPPAPTAKVPSRFFVPPLQISPLPAAAAWQQQQLSPAAGNSRQQSLSRLASSSSFFYPESPGPQQAAVAATGAVDSRPSELSLTPRKSLRMEQGARDLWPENQVMVTSSAPAAAIPAASTPAAAAAAGVALGQVLAEPNGSSSSAARPSSRLQQQQQQFLEPALRPSRTEDVSFAEHRSTGAAVKKQQSTAALAAVAAAAADIAAGQVSGTAVHDHTEPAALIAAVLQRSRSRVSSPVASAAVGVATDARSSTHSQNPDSVATTSSDQQHGPEQQVVHSSATRGISLMLQPEPSANGSVTESLTGSGKMDRASLVAAVLEKHRAKQASEAGANAGFVSSGSGSGQGPAADSGRFLQRPSSAAGSGRNSAASSMTGAKDRASIVAAVLAQRQSQRSAAGEEAAVGARGSAGLAGSVSARGDFAGLGAAGSSNGAGGSRLSTADRASLVAAVLSKHHSRRSKSFASP